MYAPRYIILGGGGTPKSFLKLCRYTAGWSYPQSWPNEAAVLQGRSTSGHAALQLVGGRGPGTHGMRARTHVCAFHLLLLCAVLATHDSRVGSDRGGGGMHGQQGVLAAARFHQCSRNTRCLSRGKKRAPPPAEGPAAACMHTRHIVVRAVRSPSTGPGKTCTCSALGAGRPYAQAAQQRREARKRSPVAAPGVHCKASRKLQQTAKAAHAFISGQQRTQQRLQQGASKGRTTHARACTALFIAVLQHMSLIWPLSAASCQPSPLGGARALPERRPLRARMPCGTCCDTARTLPPPTSCQLSGTRHISDICKQIGYILGTSVCR